MKEYARRFETPTTVVSYWFQSRNAHECSKLTWSESQSSTKRRRPSPIRSWSCQTFGSSEGKFKERVADLVVHFKQPNAISPVYDIFSSNVILPEHRHRVQRVPSKVNVVIIRPITKLNGGWRFIMLLVSIRWSILILQPGKVCRWGNTLFRDGLYRTIPTCFWGSIRFFKSQD